MTPPTDEKPPGAAGGKRTETRPRPRRRRRRSSDRSGESGDSRGEARAGGRQGHPRGRPEKANAPATVLARKTQPLDPVSETETPLSGQEIATLKVHFEFLRTHRRELRLKVNAAEDLLLNGVREPVHRGVCQHLLGKVSRSSVLSAAARLEPVRAAKLLAGVIRFSDEIEYILLFLEKVQLTSSQAEAVAALAQGLQRIDFNKVSASQMRRVLHLIGELFDARQRPRLLLGMLEGPGFREAFDSSLDGMPESLAELFLPLRAVQETVLRGMPNRFEAEALRAGVHLLLDSGEHALRALPEAVRKRLFEKGVEACRDPDHGLHRGLEVLLSNFRRSDRSFGELAMRLIRHLLASRREEEARKLLNVLVVEQPRFHLPGRWLERLDRPRIDRFAIEEAPEPLSDVMGHHRRYAGFAVDTMKPVWLQVADVDHVETHETAARLFGELCLSGVAPLLAQGATPEGAPYFAVPRPGPLLSESLEHEGGLSQVEAIAACRGAILILSALQMAGVEIGDANPGRFARDASGGLLLVDLTGGSPVPRGSAAPSALALAREFCLDMLGGARRYLPPQSLREGIASASTFPELFRVFASSPAAR